MSETALLCKKLRAASSRKKAAILAGFFKTGPGEYGEGDRFLGVVVPAIRAIAKEHAGARMGTLGCLIRSPFHEERLLALVILTIQFGDAGPKRRKEIFDFYLAHTCFINNWDLVDLTADRIIGAYLEDKEKTLLSRLARSGNLWERRIAILSTFHYIKHGDASKTLELAEKLLADKEDLIHKAVGWMLREVGKRCSVDELRDFVTKHGAKMPRTALRYAIERFPRKQRLRYLAL